MFLTNEWQMAIAPSSEMRHDAIDNLVMPSFLPIEDAIAKADSSPIKLFVKSSE